jgi:hypothetical protein
MQGDYPKPAVMRTLRLHHEVRPHLAGVPKHGLAVALDMLVVLGGLRVLSSETNESSLPRLLNGAGIVDTDDTRNDRKRHRRDTEGI